MTTKQQIIRAAAEAIRQHLPSSPSALAGKHNPDDPTGSKWAESASLAMAEAALNATPLWELLDYWEKARCSYSLAVAQKLSTISKSEA